MIMIMLSWWLGVWVAFARIVVNADYSPWINYHKVVGSQLDRTFRHPNTLREALRQHQSESYNSNLHDALMYECYSYHEGEEKAKAQRERANANSTLVPFLVDFENDTMCFLHISFPNVRDESTHSIMFSSSKFRLPLLRPLKVDSSIYRIADDADSNLPDDWQLAVAYRQEAFGSDQFSDCSQCKELIREEFAKVDSHGPIREEFFWTSSIAHTYFTSHGTGEYDEEFWDDYRRFKNINHAMAPVLTSDSGNGAPYSYAYSDAMSPQEMEVQRPNAQAKGFLSKEMHEKCNFSSLLNSELPFQTPGIFRIPLTEMTSNQPMETRVACLFVLTILFTTWKFTNHVALEKNPMILNYHARSITQSASVSNKLANQPYTSAGLRGDGQIVTIADTGVDVNSCYFFDPAGRVPPSQPNAPVFNSRLRKVIGYIYNSCGDQTDTSEGHGTHVSGTVAGYIPDSDLSTNGQYAGVAPNAKIIFNDFSRGGSGLCIPGAAQLYGIGYSGGGRIHTNSWGSPFVGSGYYSTAETDNYLRNTPGLVVFFAAGNFGGNGLGTSTITTESSAKNVIAVASGQTTLGSANISYVAWYSSKGPTYDGRFKPDIVSPGDGLMSAMASGSPSNQTCSTIEMTGTSMASPAAAGNAALVRQYFSDSSGKFWSGSCKSAYRSCRSFNPTGYLIKAVIIHSGVQMSLFNGGGEYDIQLKKPPDFMQGFGRIGLQTVLPLKGVISGFDLFVADAVNIGENSVIGYVVDVGTENKPLGATIAWYDPPNIQGTTTKSLLNDIDLVITSPTGQNYFPNGRTFKDSNNNVEKIVVPSAPTGKWKVTVSSHALPVTGNQLFAIVITSAGTVSYA